VSKSLIVASGIIGRMNNGRGLSCNSEYISNPNP